MRPARLGLASEARRLAASLRARAPRPLLRRRAPRRRVVDQPFEVELGDDVERLEIGELAVVDDLHQRAPPVEQPQDAVDLVGDLGEPLGQLAVVDLEHGLERRQLLAQAPPLVDAPHALHQQALRRQLDHVLAPDVLELDLELAVAPDQQAIDRVFAA